MPFGCNFDTVGGQSRSVIAAKQARPLEEFEERTRKEAEDRRKKREAEGGRAGGFNERQGAEERRRPRAADEGGYDDFGRRIARPSSPSEGAAVTAVASLAGGASKAERAAAALARLKGRRPQPEDRGHSSRSRSPAAHGGASCAKAKEPRQPHAGFRPRGANHRF
eukprot:TRINITY_DN25441_c0_g2_i1.p2 TRINITY_DN25441_c0_g2~~TRINITY_DN25441_c0_g2_i1.p2  ORF type:complete len:166 (+),score=39.28 TRINITY_DN25441_c0_g2_i1:29-526(+)